MQQTYYFNFRLDFLEVTPTVKLLNKTGLILKVQLTALSILQKNYVPAPNLVEYLTIHDNFGSE